MVSYDLLLFMLKTETSTGGTNSMPFLVFRRDHLRSIICDMRFSLGIICGRGSFAALYRPKQSEYGRTSAKKDCALINLVDLFLWIKIILRYFCLRKRGLNWVGSSYSLNLRKIWDCQSFSVYKPLIGRESLSHSVIMLPNRTLTTVLYRVSSTIKNWFLAIRIQVWRVKLF